MQKDLNGAVILKKNKDYSNPQEASFFYEKLRLKELAAIQFPEKEYPEGFKELVIKLMKFQNPVQMNVWHNENVNLVNQQTGEKISTTWRNLCDFKRTFSCAEMFQCVEIIKRATPDEVYDTEDASKKLKEYYLINEIGFEALDLNIINYFNEIKYPKIIEIANHIETVLFEIEEQIMAPIRGKINADLKIMNKMPLSSTFEFIKARERKM